MDYSRGKVYKVVHTPSKRFYIGSTIQSLERRLQNHFADAKRKDSELYRLMKKRPKGEFSIQLLEKTPCRNLYQLRLREEYFRKVMHPSLNGIKAVKSR